MSTGHAEKEKSDIERAAAADPVGLAMIRPDTLSICAPKSKYTDAESTKNDFYAKATEAERHGAKLDKVCSKHAKWSEGKLTISTRPVPGSGDFSGARSFLNMPDAGKELFDLTSYSQNMTVFLREVIRVY